MPHKGRLVGQSHGSLKRGMTNMDKGPVSRARMMKGVGLMPTNRSMKPDSFHGKTSVGRANSIHGKGQ